MELHDPSEFCPQLTSAGIGFDAPLLPFDLKGWASGDSPAAAADKVQMFLVSDPLMGLRAPTECFEP